jgi:hypothetical protein
MSTATARACSSSTEQSIGHPASLLDRPSAGLFVATEIFTVRVSSRWAAAMGPFDEARSAISVVRAPRPFARRAEGRAPQAAAWFLPTRVSKPLFPDPCFQTHDSQLNLPNPKLHPETSKPSHFARAPSSKAPTPVRGRLGCWGLATPSLCAQTGHALRSTPRDCQIFVVARGREGCVRKPARTGALLRARSWSWVPL